MTTTPAVTKICPNCQLRAPSDGVLCHRCFTNLLDAPTVIEGERTVRRSAPRRSAPRRALERGRDELRARPWSAAAVFALLAVAIWVYVDTIRPPGVLPSPASGSSLSVSPDPDTWPVGHGDLAGTRTTDAPARIDGEIIWSNRFSSPIAVPVVTGTSALYVGLEDGSLVALALDDGRELWRVRVYGRLDAAPTIAGDLLFFGLRGGRVVALERASGETRWSTLVGEPVYASLVVSDGVVIAATSTALVALDVVSGERLWKKETDGEFVRVPPVIDDDRIVVATNERLQILDRRTGERRYFYILSDPMSLAITGESVTATAGRFLYTFDADETNPWWESIRGAWANFYVIGLAPEMPLPVFRWRAPIAKDAFHPVVRDDRVIVAWPGGEIRAYDAVNGDVLWTREGDPIAGSPVLTADGLLVVERGALVVLDPMSGSELRRRDFPELELREGTPTAQGLVLVSSDDDVVMLR